MKLTHDFIERNSWLMIILIVLVVAVGGLVENRAAVLPAADDPAGRRCQALRAAAPVRPTSTSARAATTAIRRCAAVPRRDAALPGPLLGGRRVRLRPSRSSGAAANRAGPGARRRPLLRRMHRIHFNNRATWCPSRTCRPIRGWHEQRRERQRAGRMRALRTLGVPYTEEQDRQGARAAQRQDRLDALIAYVQGLGIEMRAVRTGG